ncbi:MAG: hypothetical protein AABX73_04250 [Nanoarchaeota archaeon]
MYKKRSIVEDITEYVKKNLKKGYTKESLRWALVEQGYSRIEVEKALVKADKELGEEAPILKPTSQLVEEVVELQDDIEKKPFWKFWS